MKRKYRDWAMGNKQRGESSELKQTIMTDFIEVYPTTRQPVKAGRREANPYKPGLRLGLV